MKIYAPLQVNCNQRTFEQNKAFHWVVSNSIFVELSTGKVKFMHDCVSDVMDSMGESPMLDMGMPKPRGEWLASASLFAPQGGEISAGQASIEIAGYKKSLNVFGDRFWQAGIPSKPQKFSQMPIDFQHAFGGEQYAMNPNGLGYQTQQLANVELTRETVTSNNSQYAPASFSPLDPSWPQRAQFQGTYDQHYIEKYFPGYPKDMDWQLFMNAAQDQWIDGFFQGNESFELSNLHPQHASISGKLPGFIPRCFIKDTKESNEQSFKEVKLQLDTVWFFPDKDLVQLIWRGGMLVSSDEAEQISHVLVAYENEKDPRRNSEHYQDALSKRILNKNPLEDNLNTLDLIPIGESSALQLLHESAMEGAQESALSSNMANKAEAIKAAVDEKVEQSLLELKQNINSTESSPQQAIEILDQVNSPSSPSQDLGVDLLLEKVDECLPGFNSGKASEIDLSEFSFNKLDEIFSEIDTFTDSKKEEVFASLKSEMESLKKQLVDQGSLQNLDEEKRKAIEEKIASINNFINNDKPPLTTLPRLDIESIKQQISVSSDEIQKAQQELHLILSNPMLANTDSIKQAQENIKRLQEEQLAKVNEELALAESQFKQGYGMGAHFSDYGLSPHEDDNRQRNTLLSIVSGDKNASNKDWACLDLSGLNLDGVDFSNCFMEQVNLTGASLIGANFSGAILVRATFDKSNCSQANFDHANIGASQCHGTTFDRASFQETKLSKTQFLSTSFIAAKIQSPEALEVEINDCDFSDCFINGFAFLELKMDKNKFHSAQFETCNFINCHLSNCNFDNASLPSSAWADTSVINSTFISADMTSNCFVSSDEDKPCTFDNLDFSKAKLNKANFQNLALSGNQFTECDLDSANFSNADLSSTNFDKAQGKQINLRKANLHGASLKKVNFMEGILTKAIITDANLEHSNLYGVDFLRARIKGTRFQGANLDASILRDWRPS